MDSRDVPLMFQAQIRGRSQIQKIEKPKFLREEGRDQQQVYDWVDEWIAGCGEAKPQLASHIKTKSYQMNWRIVSNSGQDPGVIRPVIGAQGWAYYPGASMKGAFLRACRQVAPDQVFKFCGGKGDDGELHPGVLRFHGGYPQDAKWLDQALVDVVHPQEEWQVENQKSHSAFAQVSLYQPKMVFGISSTQALEEDEWAQIWHIWEKALEKGIGSRVSAGYGQLQKPGENRLISVALKGEGLLSQRIDKSGEFRSNLFKAALRGHTLRLFAGITDITTAKLITKYLWGGFLNRQEADISKKKGAIVGQLGIGFDAIEFEPEIHTYRNFQGSGEMPVFHLENGWLHILLMQELSEKDQKNLRLWITQLIKFSLLLGGFGRSWRRADHRRFFSSYVVDTKGRNINPTIGCHWQLGQKSLPLAVPVEDLEDVAAFLKITHQRTRGLIEKKALSFLKNCSLKKPTSDIREAWYQGNVEVWGRIASNASDSHAIRWFHGPYQGKASIYQSELTGWSSYSNRNPGTMIGRIWHRMYPRYQKQGDRIQKTDEFVELLTIFPNRSGDSEQVEITRDFLSFLDTTSDFRKLW